MLKKLHEIYESRGWYTKNPCDVDFGYPTFAFVAKGLKAISEKFETGCPCCTGARILAAIVIAFALGHYL